MLTIFSQNLLCARNCTYKIHKRGRNPCPPSWGGSGHPGDTHTVTAPSRVRPLPTAYPCASIWAHSSRGPLTAGDTSPLLCPANQQPSVHTMCCQQRRMSRRCPNSLCVALPTWQWQGRVFCISSELGQSLVNQRWCDDSLWLAWGWQPLGVYPQLAVQ